MTERKVKPPDEVPEKKNNRLQSRAMYEGVTIHDLMNLFHLSRPLVTRKLSDTPPTGQRGAFNTWKLKAVAGLFVKPSGSMEQFIRAARPGDLPNELQKEYWNGLRAKQEFLKTEGSLWQTEQVVALFGKAFLLIRTSLLLLPDALERRSTLTDSQRSEAQATIDAALDGMQKVLEDAFKDNVEPKNLPGVYNVVEEIISEPDALDGVFEPVDEDDDEI